MVTFLTAVILLVLGYVVYGSIVERVFGVDANRKTPCYTMQDGVDYQPMATGKVFLIQFLNIAGTYIRGNPGYTLRTVCIYLDCARMHLRRCSP